jgi:hypothetical protein
MCEAEQGVISGVEQDAAAQRYDDDDDHDHDDDNDGSLEQNASRDLTVIQLVKKCFAFYRARRFINVSRVHKSASFVQFIL